MASRLASEQFAFNSRQAEAYKGYLITPVGFSGGGFSISKEGYHIGYASSVDEAKHTINQLL
jgi:hypothetical protein